MSNNPNEPPVMPGSLPLIGHALYLLGDSSQLWDIVKDVSYKCLAKGGVVAATIGPRTVYIVTDPDDALTVVNNCLQKDRFYDFAKPWLGEGLVTGDLSIWRNHRRLLNPAFSQVVLDSFIGVFNSQSRRLVEALDKEIAKGPFDHWVYTRHNALETICLTALGVDFTEKAVLNSEYVKAAEVIFNVIVERFQKFWLHSKLLFKWSSLRKKQDALLKILHNLSITVLEKRKTDYLKNMETCKNDKTGD
ncbi:cytochrome P450 4C1-like [Leptidea sinapis]|uniref:cytochrome P450 4C1-like n=1 Tax=Leptidea sinapis TaxID=189913 RepID=UPI0021C40CD3|nr:cytochrome P450 4C1-like [Leptidea sinapis]